MRNTNLRLQHSLNFLISLIIVLSNLIVNKSNAYTILKSDITENLALKLVDSPYISNEDVIVQKNAKLIIEPGCELRFAKGKQLIVYGTLDARGTETNRIKFTKLNDNDILYFNQSNLNANRQVFNKNNFRLVEGETILDGKLQIFYNSKWHYVCSTQFNWTEVDVNVTCKSLGYSNGTFYNYSPSNNLTSNMKMFMPRCNGSEQNLFDCPGSIDPELGLTVCDKQNIVGLVCEGFDNEVVSSNENWGGLVFQKYAPYLKTQQFTSVFYNLSQSIIEFVDIKYAGLLPNKNRLKPKFNFMPGSAITVFQYSPRFNNISVENSIGNGLNYSNLEAPGFISNSVFRYNRGHGIAAKTRFGNINIINTQSHNNIGDGLKYTFNNSIWSQQEQEEYFSSRYIEYCDSQNPLSYPAYYRFKNPNYVRECSKTFSTEPDMRITLHFQKINIKSKYSTYWLEVYDGQSDKNSLIANYTFVDGKTPEAIYSRSNRMFVKIKFQCNLPSNRKLQPIEIKQVKFETEWDELKAKDFKEYENYRKFNDRHRESSGFYKWKDQYRNELSLNQIQLREQEKLGENLKLEENLLKKQQQVQQSRIACPYTSYDDITMYAMIGDAKNPDLLVKNSQFLNNSLNGINATNLHSLIQFNYTSIKNNHMNGVHVQGGAGDVSMFNSNIETNSMNGVNISYAGGLKEFNETRISNNGLYGLVTNYNVQQEFENIFQNTTLNASVVESNMLGGVYLASYCRQSNITVNATIIRNNQEDGLIIESCKSDWYTLIDPYYLMVNSRVKRFINRTIRYTHLNVSWCLFEANRLNGLKINSIQNMIGVITNNTFINHRKGALLITANESAGSDNLIRNVSIQILNNGFFNNTGRYALNVALSNLADKNTQSINITFNRFEYNRIQDPYRDVFSPRSSACAVAVVSSINIGINQNWFNNPLSKLQIATQLDNFTSQINASFNWFHKLKPVYDLHYFLSNKEKCNQQWLSVREGIFDNSNRSNLAQIIYWPFSCNERLWFHESSSHLPPPVNFDLSAIDSFGGVYDIHDSVLPSDHYTVVNDILIKPGAKLTIKSGAELSFMNGVGILVLGELVVEGYVSSLVKFTLANKIRTKFARTLHEQFNSTKQNSSNIPKTRTFHATFGINLVDGKNSYEGRLRLEINGNYGTVCNRGWSIQNSKIACHQMGLVLDPNFYLYSHWLTNDHRQTESILMSEVQCDSLDTSLFECRHTRQSDHTCTHQDDVWIKCLRPGWAGIRFGLNAQPSSLKYALFEHAGQYDYAQAKLAPALQFDLYQHEVSNLTFQYNQHSSLEILFSQPFKNSVLNNLNFVSNYGVGLLTRASFLRVNQLHAKNHELQPGFEFNPFFSIGDLNSVRLFASEPRHGYSARRELTRLRDNSCFIGAEQMVMFYTDVEFDFGPKEFDIELKTEANRVLVVDLIDFSTNFEQETIVFCEKFCQNSFADPMAREWNLSIASNSIYFPINSSYSVLHINYNVTSFKSGRLAFLVYSVKAPEQVYDYKNPAYIYLKNVMPENVLKINNSTFNGNRHSIVFRHYDDTVDVFGNLRKRYDYSNIIVSNCTFNSNDQVFWINTDPVFPNINQRVNNLTVHVMKSLSESSKDDVLISETGYQMYDLVPRVKLGPIGRINVTFEDCIFRNNYGGIRSLYRYQEYSNTIWHFEIRNNKFIENKQSCLKLSLPRIYRFSLKNQLENTTHSLNLRNNEFIANSLFEISIDGYYAQINITKNLFIDNNCRLGLIKFSGTEKDFFIYNNKIERNEANFIFDLEAKSHVDNDFNFQSLFVENEISKNQKLSNPTTSLLITNSPSSYTIALRGIQNCTISKNIFENEMFDYEFVGALVTNTLNSTIDATINWWGTSDPNSIKKRIFDMHEWNNHAMVNFVPFYADKIIFSLSRRQPDLSVNQNLNKNVLGGILCEDMSLSKTTTPYQIRADLTIMPGATLYINPGVEIEFYPNIGILVLGDLKASGSQENFIKMRPVKKLNNRMPFYSDNFNSKELTGLNTSEKLRFFNGLNPNEGFLQIYNTTLRSWTHVCDKQFTLTSASIVCKQMNKEYRNPHVESLFYYMPPNSQAPIWNQTFVCQGGEQTLAECDTFANYHTDECRSQGEYTYVMCKSYNLDKQVYEHSWGGIRFAQPYFETYSPQFAINDRPIFLKPEFQPTQQQDASYMFYVDIIGAGRLHNEPNPSVQLIYRTPLISNFNIKNSTFHGLEFMQSKSTIVFNKLKIESSLGYGVNGLQLNVQTTDQKSSFKTLSKNTLSNQNLFSMIDICDAHKYYDLDQRVIIYYKYSSMARDCVKIFRTRLSSNNLGGSGQIAIRFLQIMLVNNTIQNDTIEIYNGTLFRKSNLMTVLSNQSSVDEFERFYLSKTDSLSVYLRAGVGREYYGFIAEVLVYPTSQYLSTDTYIELSDSDIKSNEMGALRYVSAGERNPNLYLVRNRFESNGFEYFNSTSPPSVDVILQNTPKFYFGNNFINKNYGGVSLSLHSGSGVLITSSIVYNNLFLSNRNNTVLEARGGLHLPYNEITIDKNTFLENESPRTDIALVSGLVSKFTRNQLVYNRGARILFTQGFENVSTPRNQDISFNLFRDNYAHGMVNELEDPNRFRSTIVAASVKQIYYANYLFNKENDFELTALTDPLTISFLMSLYTNYGNSKMYGMVAHTGAINASFNYWSTNVESEIRARIRDKYDNGTLFEVSYSPPVLDEFKLRDGKCELGWTLIDDTCYTYVGSYVTYKEAETICKKFESRLARETVAPIKLPRFRKLARTTQFDYETQSYRKIWLYSESPSSSKCSVIDDFGVLSSNCIETLPFICEKDPVFSGAAFRFKDEIAFAIAAILALIVCIILLSILWLCKSRKRKKEHIDRQNTLRTSARTNRQMISNTGSTLKIDSINKPSLNLYDAGNTSFDTLSATRGSRTLNGGIYNSQRNKYFTNKKHKENKNEFTEIENKNNSSFIATGLDPNQGSSFYGTTEKQSIINPSIQYHVFDPNITSKSSVKYGELESNDADTTTTEELSERTEVKKRDFNRVKGHSPGDSSNRTIATNYTDNINGEMLDKEFIQAKLIKSNVSPIHTENDQLKPKSYNSLMNTTFTTDTEDDFQDGNSKRLLTNKMNMSNIVSSTMKKNFANEINFETETNNKSSDYENLSNSAINDILFNYPSHLKNLKNHQPQIPSKRNIYTTLPKNGNNLLQVKPQQPPPPPQTHAPELKQFSHESNNKRHLSIENDDNESMMSCQLITSSSLLLNRENVKEAKRIIESKKQVQERYLVPPMRKNVIEQNRPILSPRSFIPANQHYDVLVSSLANQDANVQLTQTDSDASKPPPMETAI